MGTVVKVKPTVTSSRRRGRPRADEVGQRRHAVLDAALAELVERGYERASMLAIARRARASKETLYAWFGNKEGLFMALVRQQSLATNQRIEAALDADDGGGDPAVTLTAVARGLLHLLVSDTSLALNRAAMAAPELAATLLAQGRHTTGPLVERYLARAHAEGWLSADDPADAFRLLYGLVVEDTQIRALLGENPPAAAELDRRATRAVRRFLALTAP
jgi:AcrR family transcriptional regulator